MDEQGLIADPSAFLAGVTVLEVCAEPAGRFAGRLFAGAGARVVHVRPSPGGALDTTNPVNAFLDDGKLRDPQVGSAGSVISPRSRSLNDLAATCDVMIADPGFAWSDVPSTHRPPLSGTVDPFSAQGARATWLASEAVLASEGGAALFTQRASGEPVPGIGRRYQYLAGQYLFVALTAMLGTDSTGSSLFPAVRVSALETVVSMLPYPTTQYAYNGTCTTVEQSGPRFVSECTDGYLCIYAGGTWPDLARFLGELVEPEDDRFISLASRFRNVDDLRLLCDSRCGSLSVAEAISRADEFSVAVAPVRTVADVAEEASRSTTPGVWRSVATGDGLGYVPSAFCCCQTGGS